MVPDNNHYHDNNNYSFIMVPGTVQAGSTKNPLPVFVVFSFEYAEPVPGEWGEPTNCLFDKYNDVTLLAI